MDFATNSCAGGNAGPSAAPSSPPKRKRASKVFTPKFRRAREECLNPRASKTKHYTRSKKSTSAHKPEQGKHTNQGKRAAAAALKAAAAVALLAPKPLAAGVAASASAAAIGAAAPAASAAAAADVAAGEPHARQTAAAVTAATRVAAAEPACLRSTVAKAVAHTVIAARAAATQAEDTETPTAGAATAAPRNNTEDGYSASASEEGSGDGIDPGAVPSSTVPAFAAATFTNLPGSSVAIHVPRVATTQASMPSAFRSPLAKDTGSRNNSIRPVVKPSKQVRNRLPTAIITLHLCLKISETVQKQSRMTKNAINLVKLSPSLTILAETLASEV